MNIIKNNLTRLLAVFALAAVFASAAHAADRYVYYSLSSGSTVTYGVCDDSTDLDYHATSHSAAVFVYVYSDGISNGLHAMEVEVDDTYAAGTYMVATLDGSSEKVYLVITN